MSFTEHSSVQIPLGKLALTDLKKGDIDAIVDFWYGGSADHEFLGVDKLKLGHPDDTRLRFEKAIRTGEKSQETIAFAIRLNDKMIGYTLLNRYTPEINYSHWHIMTTSLRGSGISTTMYPYRLKMYFDLFPISRLIHQTRTRNIAVNRMLDKYIPIAETGYVTSPDGVALPGDFHTRYVLAGDIPGFFKTLALMKENKTDK